MADVLDNSLTKGAGDLLGKKYGPLPFGVWLVIVAGTAFAVKKFVNKQETATNTVASDQASSSSGGSSIATPSNATVSTGIGASAGNAGTDTGSTGANGTSYTASYADNQAWKVAAIADIVTMGQYSGTEADTALRAYLSGTSVTDPRQKTIIDTAIKAAGLPPEAISASPVSSTAAKGNSTITVVPQTQYQNVPANTPISWQVQWLAQGSSPISGALRKQALIGVNPDIWTDAGTIMIVNGVGTDSHPGNGVSGSVRYATLLTETVYAPAVSAKFSWNFVPTKAQQAAINANIAAHKPTKAAVAANNLAHGLNANGTPKKKK